MRGDARDPRLGGDRGAGDLVGRRPSQAPRVLRPAGRSAQPARRPRRRLARRAARACCTPTSAGCSATTSAAPATRYAPDLLADPVMRFVDRTFVVWAVGGLALPFALGVRDRRLAATPALTGAAVGRRGAAASSCTTSPTASTRSATSSAAGASRPPDESRNVFWLAAALVRRVVAQQPPRLPDLGAPRARPLAARSVGARHPWARGVRPGVGRWSASARSASTAAAVGTGEGADVRVTIPAARPPRRPGSSSSVPSMVITGLTLLLIVDVRGVAFYVAWALIVLALATEGAGDARVLAALARATAERVTSAATRCEHVFVSSEATILHADLDSFYASVEQRDDPRLRGRPVIVGGGRRARRELRGQGAAACARRWAARQARRLCPHAVVVPPRMSAYSEASRAVFEVFDDTTPLVEGLSIDEAFLDVRGLRADRRGRRSRSPCGCAARCSSGSACRSRSAWRGRSSWPRWPAAWPSPTACSWCRPTASSPSCTRCRSSGCGASGPVTAGKLRERGITTVGEVAAARRGGARRDARPGGRAASSTRWPTTATRGRCRSAAAGARSARSARSGRRRRSPEAELDAVARRARRPGRPPAARRAARRPHRRAAAALRRLLARDALAHAAAGHRADASRSSPPRGRCWPRPRRRSSAGA